MGDQNELGSRRLHHWRGQDRKADVDALADAIAATGELFNHNGTLVRLDQGKLVQLNRVDFREFVDQHIAAVRAVNRGTADRPNWQREYSGYAFSAGWRHDPSRGGPQEPPEETTPDERVLDEIFRHELLRRIPRVDT